MQQENRSAYLSILRLFAIYWVVLVQHNFAYCIYAKVFMLEYTVPIFFIQTY